MVIKSKLLEGWTEKQFDGLLKAIKSIKLLQNKHFYEAINAIWIFNKFKM